MKIRKNRRKYQLRYLKKGALELYRAATTKPRQIERSVFFLVDHNGQTRVYRLVSGQPDCAPPALTRGLKKTYPG